MAQRPFQMAMPGVMSPAAVRLSLASPQSVGKFEHGCQCSTQLLAAPVQYRVHVVCPSVAGPISSAVTARRRSQRLRLMTPMLSLPHAHVPG